MKYISLSGSISVGKTSTAKLLAEQLGKEAIFLEDVAKITSLNKFYHDARRYGFISRVEFLCDKAETHISARNSQGVSVFDRSFMELPLFASVLQQRGSFDPDEFNLYRRTHKLIAESVPDLDAVIWLRCQPKISLERVRSRNRDFEKGIEITYLEALDREYEIWFNSLTKVQKIRIDTSMQDAETVLQIILDFLK